VKTKNPSACGKVNCKVFRIAIALYFLYSPSCEYISCNKSNHLIQTPTRDNIIYYLLLINKT
jgi:hypothetical protein